MKKFRPGAITYNFEQWGGLYNSLQGEEKRFHIILEAEGIEREARNVDQTGVCQGGPDLAFPKRTQNLSHRHTQTVKSHTKEFKKKAKA